MTDKAPDQYAWVTEEMFDEKLRDMVEGHDLIDIPGVYPIVREHLNNHVIKALKEDHPDKATQGEYDVFVEKWHDKLLTPQIILDDWFVVNLANDETVVYPRSLFTREAVSELHPDATDIEEEGKKIAARLSAPGYLDRTEWALFDTKEEAMEYLMEEYGDE